MHSILQVKIGPEKNFIRTQPEKTHLPFGLTMWFDATQISGSTQDTNATPIPGMQISTWVDLSGNARHMNNVNGDPTIAMDGYEGRAVVDFDGNDQLISTYDFAREQICKFGEMGVTRLLESHGTRGAGVTGVISSQGQNWIMGHHGNRNGRYYFNGWVHQGHAADTEFHIWEIKQEGRSHNGNPYSTVYADGVELANNQNSNNWWHHPVNCL